MRSPVKGVPARLFASERGAPRSLRRRDNAWSHRRNTVVRSGEAGRHDDREAVAIGRVADLVVANLVRRSAWHVGQDAAAGDRHRRGVDTGRLMRGRRGGEIARVRAGGAPDRESNEQRREGANRHRSPLPSTAIASRKTERRMEPTGEEPTGAYLVDALDAGAAPQQSLVVVHFSYCAEHVGSARCTPEPPRPPVAEPAAALVAGLRTCPSGGTARPSRSRARCRRGAPAPGGRTPGGSGRCPAPRSRSTAATQSFLSRDLVEPRVRRAGRSSRGRAARRCRTCAGS